MKGRGNGDVVSMVRLPPLFWLGGTVCPQGPPYGNLEAYGNDSRDLSRMCCPAFMEAYRTIVWRSVRCLKKNRFACFVVGNFRASNGTFRPFVTETIQAFKDAEADLYNEAILLNRSASAPLRAGIPFEVARKPCRVHQTVLVFSKGCP